MRSFRQSRPLSAADDARGGAGHDAGMTRSDGRAPIRAMDPDADEFEPEATIRRREWIADERERGGDTGP
jgi:hypothetical protein